MVIMSARANIVLNVQCFDTYSVNLRSGFNIFRVIAYIFSALSAVCLFSLVCVRTFFLCSFGLFCVCFCAWSACHRRTDVCDVCTFDHLLIHCVVCFTRSFFANITQNRQISAINLQISVSAVVEGVEASRGNICYQHPPYWKIAALLLLSVMENIFSSGKPMLCFLFLCHGTKRCCFQKIARKTQGTAKKRIDIL